MAQGTFERAIPVDLNKLEVMDAQNNKVTLFNTSTGLRNNGVAVTFRVNDEHEKFIGYITVRYFGKHRNDRLWLNSFIYSVQNLRPIRYQKHWNEDPFRTAKWGLELIGVVF